MSIKSAEEWALKYDLQQWQQIAVSAYGSESINMADLIRAIQRDALEAAAEAANKIKRDYENTTFPNIYRECPWAVEKVVKAICKLQDGL
jgi:hypothetical protein